MLTLTESRCLLYLILKRKSQCGPMESRVKTCRKFGCCNIVAKGVGAKREGANGEGVRRMTVKELLTKEKGSVAEVVCKKFRS